MQSPDIADKSRRDGSSTTTETRGSVTLRFTNLPAAVRILVGLNFLMVGLNGFLDFLPRPATLPAGAAGFMGGLAAAGYMLPLISGTQVVAALLLLSNRFVPLALAVLAPVIVNIVLFHAFLYPAGAIMAGIATLLYLYLVWTYRSVYAAMLAMRVDTSRL